VAASHARSDIYWFDLSDWGWQGSEFTLHGYLGEHVWFGAFAVIPFDCYRMVAFVAGTLPAPVSSDVVRPADSYVVHCFLLPIGYVCPIIAAVGESEQE